ncbi:MAG TPA: hypothetical protein VJI32_08065, partial [Candidatus Nanoarchaeia archaeon]|nr:hypothetical protein [Candidatus Nanoarchaeia archaeon]
MSKPGIMLLIDPSHGGFGDITMLLRIGKFLISRGYDVYYTVVFFPYHQNLIDMAITSLNSIV